LEAPKEKVAAVKIDLIETSGASRQTSNSASDDSVGVQDNEDVATQLILDGLVSLATYPHAPNGPIIEGMPDG
jgi:hypothetical protein